jgi:hypothetical protein
MCTIVVYDEDKEVHMKRFIWYIGFVCSLTYLIGQLLIIVMIFTGAYPPKWHNLEYVLPALLAFGAVGGVLYGDAPSWALLKNKPRNNSTFSDR